MKKISILCAFVFISSLMYLPSTALAATSTENNLNTIFEMIQKEVFNRSKLCNEFPKKIAEQPAEILFTKARDLSTKSKHCDAADIYYEIRRHYPIKPYYFEATKQMLNSYFAAGDYGLVINTANYLLEGNLSEKNHAGEVRGTLIEEDIHFLIIRSVYVQMKEATASRNQEWTEYALAIRGDQTDKYVSNLSFESFIQKFPQGNNAILVQKWLKEARNQLAEHHLIVGHTYFHRRDFVASLARYNLVNKWGVSVEPFGESMYYSIVALNELSYEILDQKLMNDRSIRELAHLSDSEGINRQELSEKTKAKARELSALLQKALPHSSWAARAKSALTQRYLF